MDEAELSLKRSTTQNSTSGEKLRYARERRGLSQQEVAGSLCLPVAVIDALERDDYEKLPAPVFVIGYLKNYARFLDIPVSNPNADHNINALQVGPTPFTSIYKPVSLNSLSSISSIFISAKSILLKLFNYAVLIALLLLVFLWWHEKHHAAEKTISLNNISIQKSPFPRDNLEPYPPDLRPWLDDVLISTGKNP